MEINDIFENKKCLNTSNINSNSNILSNEKSTERAFDSLESKNLTNNSTNSTSNLNKIIYHKKRLDNKNKFSKCKYQRNVNNEVSIFKSLITNRKIHEFDDINLKDFLTNEIKHMENNKQKIINLKNKENKDSNICDKTEKTIQISDKKETSLKKNLNNSEVSQNKTILSLCLKNKLASYHNYINNSLINHKKTNELTILKSNKSDRRSANLKNDNKIILTNINKFAPKSPKKTFNSSFHRNSNKKINNLKTTSNKKIITNKKESLKKDDKMNLLKLEIELENSNKEKKKKKYCFCKSTKKISHNNNINININNFAKDFFIIPKNLI
jgi:hypothetical protein